MTLDDLDALVRAALVADARISHALAYGSRTQRRDGKRLDDAFSDLEYYVYLPPVGRSTPAPFWKR